MKKLFTISDGRSVFVREEGKVYELRDWRKKERTFCDAEGHLLPNYRPLVMEELDECFYHGLLSVRGTGDLWGCIDEKGTLVIPYQFFECLRFNQYGVAAGNNILVDRQGNALPGTEHNLEDCCDASSRYFTTALLTKEQIASIDACGSAEGILLDIYDTKLRKYVARGVPDGKIETAFFEGEAEVILAAMELLPHYDEIALEGQGTILAKKDEAVTIYDYYQE